MTVTALPGMPLPPIVQRLSWLTELMGRYAGERLETGDCTRLAAAIVIHLRALHEDLDGSPGLAASVEHWLERWERILDRAIRQTSAQDRSATLGELVAQARRFG